MVDVPGVEEMKDEYIEESQKWHKLGFEAGQQSRQAEIDELQKRIDKVLSEIQDGVKGRNHIEYITGLLRGKSE